MNKNKKIKIQIETNYDQWDLIDRNKFDLIKDNTDMKFSKEYDHTIYVQGYADSFVESKNRVIKCVREHDLVMLEKINNSVFTVPDYMHFRNISDYMGYMVDDENYLLKIFSGARSVGQMFVNKYNILKIIADAKRLSNDKFNEKYDIDTSTCQNDNEKNILRKKINNGDFFIMRCIPFIAEYRVLYFKGANSKDYIIENREGYQVNSTIPRKHNCITLEESKLDQSILDEIKDFGDDHDSPMLSFDVWVDSDGVYGLFEYSNQFGVDYEEKEMKIIYNQFNESIMHEIKEQDLLGA